MFEVRWKGKVFSLSVHKKGGQPLVLPLVLSEVPYGGVPPGPVWKGVSLVQVRAGGTISLGLFWGYPLVQL